MDNEIIIKVTPHSEGGLNYDIFLNVNDANLPDDSDDGGICTSEMHVEDCSQEDGCDNEDCEALCSKPYSRQDWENAFDMAKEQALDLLFPKKR